MMLSVRIYSPLYLSPLTSHHNRPLYFRFLSQEGSAKWNLRQLDALIDPYLTSSSQAVKLRATCKTKAVWCSTRTIGHQLFFLCSNLLGCYGQRESHLALWPSADWSAAVPVDKGSSVSVTKVLLRARSSSTSLIYSHKKLSHLLC